MTFKSICTFLWLGISFLLLEFCFAAEQGPLPQLEVSPPNTKVSALAVSPDGNLLAIGYQYGAISLWRLKNIDSQPNGLLPQAIFTFAPGTPYGSGGAIIDMDFSPDGKNLAVINGRKNSPVYMGHTIITGRVEIYEVASGKLIAELMRDGYEARTVRFSPDGAALAVGSTRQEVDEIQLWDAKTFQARFNLPEAKGFALAFAPGGKMVATTGGAYNRGFRLWDIESGELRDTIREGGRLYDSLAYSGDGKHVAAGHVISKDGYNVWWSFKIWDAQTKLLKHTLNVNPDPTQTVEWNTAKAINGMAFSPDGHLLAGSIAYETQAWEVAEGKALWNLHNVSGPLIFLGGGKLLVGVEKTGALGFYDTEDGHKVATLGAWAGSQYDGDGKPDKPIINWVFYRPDGMHVTSHDFSLPLQWRVGEEVRPYKDSGKGFWQADLWEKTVKPQ